MNIRITKFICLMIMFIYYTMKCLNKLAKTKRKLTFDLCKLSDFDLSRSILSFLSQFSSIFVYVNIIKSVLSKIIRRRKNSNLIKRLTFRCFKFNLNKERRCSCIFTRKFNLKRHVKELHQNLFIYVYCSSNYTKSIEQHKYLDISISSLWLFSNQVTNDEY